MFGEVFIGPISSMVEFSPCCTMLHHFLQEIHVLGTANNGIYRCSGNHSSSVLFKEDDVSSMPFLEVIPLTGFDYNAFGVLYLT